MIGVVRDKLEGWGLVDFGGEDEAGGGLFHHSSSEGFRMESMNC